MSFLALIGEILYTAFRKVSTNSELNSFILFKEDGDNNISSSSSSSSSSNSCH